MRRLLRLGLVLAALFLALDAEAQSLNFASEDSDDPIEVYADNGIEWQQEGQIFLARGNALAKRGDVEVYADTLKAYYRKKASGGTDLWRLDADGNVRIITPSENATGQLAVYDVDNGVLVLQGRGQKVKIISGPNTIIADDQLEYWEKKQMMVARGNALAISEDNKLHARVLSAHMKRDRKTGKTRIYKVEAFDDVSIVTPEDVVRSEKAVYNVETSIATLTGSVRITRDGNQLKGCSATVNMKTGVSKLKSCKNSGQRVRGLLLPGDVKKKN